MRKTEFWTVRLLFLAMLFSLLIPTAGAANRVLTVAPKDIETESYFVGRPISICQITEWDGASHVLSEAFQSTTISLDVLLGEKANDYAVQVYDYVKAHDVSVTTLSTGDDGKAVFSPVPQGLYLICSFDEGFFAPFLVDLTVNTLCEPKVELHNDPGPEPDPGPDSSSSSASASTSADSSQSHWRRPAKTGDDTPVQLYYLLFCVGALGVVTMEVMRRRRKGKN